MSHGRTGNGSWIGLLIAQSISEIVIEKADYTLCTLRCWNARARQRHHLARLTDEQLADIGITHKMARREVEKPFWKA